jgi:uncharacterized damage-inducible protein DinB
MSNQIAQAFLSEFDHELATTRKFLERVPEDKLAWRPHEKSMTAGQLALHVAQMPMGVLQMSLKDQDAVPDFSRGRQQPESLKEILDALDESKDSVHKTLPTIDDARMSQIFTVTRDAKPVMALPRVVFLRMIMLNHWYHHRGQLGVYLRLLGAKVPASYGPSGDEAPM